MKKYISARTRKNIESNIFLNKRILENDKDISFWDKIMLRYYIWSYTKFLNKTHNDDSAQ